MIEQSGMPSLNIIISNQLSKVAAETTMDLQGLVSSMKDSGMSDKAIKDMLMNDLTSGGRVFGNFRNQVKNTVKSGVGISASNSSRASFESAGVKEYRWVAVGDKNVCPDCERRNGDIGDMEFWKTVGLPQSGFSICRYNCRCQLLPSDYAGEDLDKPILKKEFKKEKLIKNKEANDILNKLDDPKEALKVARSLANGIEKGNMPERFLVDYFVDELKLNPVEANLISKEIKKIPQDLSKYINNVPGELDDFLFDMDKWTRGVDFKARDSAVDYFWDQKELRDYLHADLITNLRASGSNIKSIESFRNTTHKLYRSGTTLDGNNSFLFDKGGAINYNKRFGADSIIEIEVKGENIIPTTSGAGEVVVHTEDIISEKILK